jgi:nitrogen regulatory protein PII
MQMVMFVLDDPNQLDKVLDAWRAVGVSGVTIMESTGFHRRRAYVLGARHLLSTSLLAERIEEGHYTLFAVVPDLQAAEQCLTATERVVGDLDGQSTGIFAAWEVALTKGVLNHLLPGEEGQ